MTTIGLNTVHPGDVARLHDANALNGVETRLEDALPPAVSQSIRAMNAATRAQDVEFAFQIGSDLLNEVRRLQNLIGERDKAIEDAKFERADLENMLDGLRSALKVQEETADNFREETWNLEIALQELRSQLHEARSPTQLNKDKSEESQIPQTVSTISQLHALSRIHPAFDELSKLLRSFEKFDVAPRLTVGEFRANGGYADVYDGWLIPEGHALASTSEDVHEDEDATHGNAKTQMKVAIKQFRVFRNQSIEFAKEFVRELRLWANFNHPNVLPLLGFTLVEKSPSLVSEWMDNGTVLEYVKRNPQTSAAAMSEGIADGLAFLHANSVIHADLKSDNVLVDRDGTPVLCDFGISRVVIESKTVTGTSTLKGNIRWMSVELLQPQVPEGDAAKHQFHTRESDVWAYGMVVNEMLSHAVPFHDIIHEGQVIMAIGSGQRPAKPVTCSDPHFERLWSICVSCWANNPKERPKMAEICAKLKTLPNEQNASVAQQESAGNDRLLSAIARFETYGTLLDYFRGSQSAIREDESRSIITNILSFLLLRVPERYLYKFERMGTHGVDKAEMWRSTVDELVGKWNQCATFSAIILSSDIYIFAAANSGYIDDRWVAKYLRSDSPVAFWTFHNINKTSPHLLLVLLSLLACMASISTSLLFSQRRRKLLKVPTWLLNENDSKLSLEMFAIMCSLPQAMFEWAIGLHVSGIAAGYVLEMGKNAP